MEIKIDKIFHIGMVKKAVSEFAPETHLYEIADIIGEEEDTVYEFCLLKGKKAAQFKVRSSQLNDYSHLKDVIRKAYGRIAGSQRGKHK
jgi:hypothetical protein